MMDVSTLPLQETMIEKIHYGSMKIVMMGVSMMILDNIIYRTSQIKLSHLYIIIIDQHDL
jgi:hypothetical protein